METNCKKHGEHRYSARCSGCLQETIDKQKIENQRLKEKLQAAEVTLELRDQDVAELQDVLTLANGGQVLDTGLWADMKRQRDDAVAETERLRAVAGPFAALASGIPDNWPGECRLRIDTRRDQSEFLNYHGVPEEHRGVLPTIDQWRAVAKAAAEAAKGK